MDLRKQTPFLTAVQKDRAEAAVELLEQGANMKAVDMELRNCFHLATKNLSINTLKMLIPYDKESLIEKTESRLQNSLHYAAAVGNVEVRKHHSMMSHFKLYSQQGVGVVNGV